MAQTECSKSSLLLDTLRKSDDHDVINEVLNNNSFGGGRKGRYSEGEETVKSTAESFVSAENCNDEEIIDGSENVKSEVRDDGKCCNLKMIWKKVFSRRKSSPATITYPLDKCPFLLMHTPEVIVLEFPVNGICLAEEVKITIDPSLNMLLSVEANGLKSHRHSVRLPSVAGYNFQNAKGYGYLYGGDLKVRITNFNSQLVNIPIKS